MAGGLSHRHGRWVAAIWLIYLGFVFVEPSLSRAPLWIWVVSALSIVVFIPLYFAAFEMAAQRPRQAAAMLALTTAMGLAIVPFNIGGATYVIFSAAVAGFVFRRRRDTVLFVLAIASALLLTMRLTRDPFLYWMMFQPVITVMVGIGNIVAAEERRRNAELRQAREDVEELAKLAERERIARDLHDVLGHTLSVIALKSELASKLADIDPQRATQEIREVERVSREALSEVRAAVEGYRGRGLRGELQRASEVLKAAGVSLETDVASITLPPKQETALALAVREAITNVVRHADATRCRISLALQAGGTVLRVEDDGVGGVEREGNGLAGMRERVAAVGGTLTIQARAADQGSGRAGDATAGFARRGVALTVVVP